ncbi:hypothetical protein Lfu02_80590 [Longispora fulva]|uniref:Uncharacterized protein n=1 Tax=Longispora fulva TaxID=619741 RepID=A0A8J7GXU3_9ACTN|nr:hypothetical protein [Longispora fulva]MBG6141149.1 hypothetical protein [Longispora fulva]GIG63687.1 hypothetical protein Lfu02_80590 [Longispora fulva]
MTEQTDTPKRRAVREAAEVMRAAKPALHKAIVEAKLDGAKVGEIAADSGYAREQVRRILRANGIEAD